METGIPNVEIQQLDALRKQAEDDKNAALNALENRSREFMQA